MEPDHEPGREDDLSDSSINHEENGQQSNIHISDVIAAIQNTDPSFEAADMFGGGMTGPNSTMAGPSHPVQNPHPYVRIVEQPASKSLRFRYECEGRCAGSIPGAHSTAETKTFPTIEVVGYKGRAVVVVSCVTKDSPYRPHPHNLVGKDGCKKGVCTVEINSENMRFSFSNLGIQCVKRKDIEDALRIRKEIRVDPFRTNFSHMSQPTNIDLNAVRLCFQVFLEGSERGKFTRPLDPIVSEIIYDKKAMSDLVICKMSHCSAPVAGGREIILLCEKVTKEDIEIKFYEEIDGKIVWEGKGDFQHANVHKQVAIAFRSPRYHTLEIEQPVKVFIQLRRPSDGTVSDPLPFEMLPLDSDPVELKRKRQKFGGDINVHLRRLQPPIQEIASMDPLTQQQNYNIQVFAPIPEQPIKIEPRDQTPSPYAIQASPQFGGMYRNTQGTPSPQPHAASSPPLDYNLEGWSHTPLHHNNILPLLGNNVHRNAGQATLQSTSVQPLQPNTNIPNMGNLVASLQAGGYRQNIRQPTTAESNVAQSSGIPSMGLPGLQNISEQGSLSSLLDMDNQQFTHLNAADLVSYLEGSTSYEPNSFQVSNSRMDIERENMTDSFTRMRTRVLEELTGEANLSTSNAYDKLQ